MTELTRGREAMGRALVPFSLTAAALALLLVAPLVLSTVSLARGPESVAGIAEGLQDTVVNISTTQTLKGSAEKDAPPAQARKARPSRSSSTTSSTTRTRKDRRGK